MRRPPSLVAVVELDEISYEKRDGVAEITLDRPSSLNPISARPGGTRDQILQALGDAEDDPAIGCVLLAGEGSAFSAGGDLAGNRRRESAAEEHDFVERSDAFHRRLRGSPLPTVAAVHGYCLGAGLALALSCDLVVAAEGARFGVPEGRIGLVGAVPLVPVVGRQWAKFLIMTGEMVDARRACAIGLALTVVPEGELRDRCRELARRVARMPREAVLLNRKAIDAVGDSMDAAGLAAGRAHDAVTLANAARATAPDGRTFRDILDAEGMAGLKEARRQQWEDSWLGE
jgi:enoyl-CoA hydratase/carnithine racemase